MFIVDMGVTLRIEIRLPRWREWQILSILPHGRPAAPAFAEPSLGRAVSPLGRRLSTAAARSCQDGAAMLRMLFSLYMLGIFVSLGLFLILLPRIPFVDAVVGALVWPWGVYRYFIAT
jgi:hypothetical protein